MRKCNRIYQIQNSLVEELRHLRLRSAGEIQTSIKAFAQQRHNIFMI